MASIPLPEPGIALDFVNTRTRDEDHLGTPKAATTWARGVLGTRRRLPALTEADLPPLRELRDLLGHLFDDVAPESVAGMNDVLANVRLEGRLDAEGGATYSIEIDSDDPAGVIARMVLGSLLQLADGPGLTSVRQCAASDCSIRFVSTNARRIWCDTSTCGNRERARRHYRRRTAANA